MSKIKILALFGESSSGKDTILNQIVSVCDVNKIISCTTRPKRDYEREGIDYYYLGNDEFGEEVINGNMLEATEFNGWFYGTRLSELKEDKVNIGVFNIAGVECLLEDSRLEVLPVYIMAYDKTRLLRALTREKKPNCHEICRRFLADEKDFYDIDFEYQCYINEDFNDNEIFDNSVISDFLNFH